MIYADIVLGFIVGVALTIYSLHGVADPYWSRATRMVSGVGAVVGMGLILLSGVALVFA